MKTVYERTCLIITQFNTEDVIITSAPAPTEAPAVEATEKENFYGDYSTFEIKLPNQWF